MNTRKLFKRLTDPIEKFAKLGDTEYTKHGPLTYIDRGGDVLAVAHLDSVDYCEFNVSPRMKRQYGNVRIENCPQLDDRLGAWMVLDVLPRAGIKCDVLLTDSEEIGDSTAQFFKPPKQYNWMMQFDRAGSDMVMYDYHDSDLDTLMRSYEYTVSRGAYTDICYLQHLKCKGFNFGVGYHSQHSEGCFANLSETFDSFRKVQSFYDDHMDKHFHHTKVVRPKPALFTGRYKGNVIRSITPAIVTSAIKWNQKDEEEEAVTCEYDIEDLCGVLGLSHSDCMKGLDSCAQEMFSCTYRWCSDEERKEVEYTFAQEMSESQAKEEHDWEDWEDWYDDLNDSQLYLPTGGEQDGIDK